MYLSVIIPMYNVEKYIVRCLDSILRQNLQDCEVLLVDDGSRDGTVKRVRDYLSDSPSAGYVRLIESENAGASAARNRGIDAASGDYIVFVDSDDCLAEHAFDHFRRKSLETDADLYVFGFLISDLTNEIRSELCEKENFVCMGKDGLSCLRQYLEKTDYLSTWQPWAKIFRRSIIEEHHVRYDTRLFSSNDFDFFFHYFRHVKCVSFDHTPVYVYTADRPGSITSTKLQKRAESNMRATADLFKAIREKDKAETVLMEFVSRLYLGSLELCADMSRKEIEAIRRFNRQNEEVYCYSGQRLAVFKRFLYRVLGFKLGAKAVVLIRRIEYFLKGKSGQLSVPRKVGRT